jgi:RNA polymerase sigma factor (sigma-70 family)
VPESENQNPENKEDGQHEEIHTHFLFGHQKLLARMYVEAGQYSWGLTRVGFERALERSARKRFGTGPVLPENLENYLGTLHLKDLALASACIEGHAQAWEYFVAAYQPYLRAAAGGILHCPPDSPAASEFADSLFAELYGLKDGPRPEQSLFRYFHGRSSLKTWLRAILAQRHIDNFRAGRRFTDLDEQTSSLRCPENSIGKSPVQTPLDPHRDRYVALFTRTLGVALGLLARRDKERLRLYYAEEQTLAEIGRKLNEHESSVSRNLERTRRQLRQDVEQALRKGRIVTDGLSAEPGLSEAEISLCFEYAAESAPIDLEKLFPPRTHKGPTAERQGS